MNFSRWLTSVADRTTQQTKQRCVFPVCVYVLAVAVSPTLADDRDLPRQAATALHKAVGFFREEVASGGGYLWAYSEDLRIREGEERADEFTIWTQPPGTPSVGMAMLHAYWRTGDKFFLDGAREAGEALIRTQLRSGGWDSHATFDPNQRRNHAYRVDPPTSKKKPRNTTTLDDDKTQSCIRFLIHLDKTLDFEDAKLHEAVLYALDHLIEAQFPNGAWPQRFSDPPNKADYPVLAASYPDTWSRTFPNRKYSIFYTFNDNAMADAIDVMFLAARVYGEAKYTAAAERAGDFILRAQMPEPQPAWAQQYDVAMHPAWARKFEPPAVTGGESQGIMRILMTIYRSTGKQKYLKPVPRALEYLKASVLNDGRLARFYELKTNRPLYFTRDYQLTYSDADVPTHYAFKVSNKLESIDREYQKLVATPKKNLGLKPYSIAEGPTHVSSSLEKRARQIIDALDARGRWLENGQLKTQIDDDSTQRVIRCKTFITNVEILADYLGAANR